jgi:hypothetical protein
MDGVTSGISVTAPASAVIPGPVSAAAPKAGKQRQAEQTNAISSAVFRRKLFSILFFKKPSRSYPLTDKRNPFGTVFDIDFSAVAKALLFQKTLHWFIVPVRINPHMSAGLQGPVQNPGADTVRSGCGGNSVKNAVGLISSMLGE